jgi:hypothetical protein
MKKVMLFTLAVLSASSCLFAQTAKNPFSKFGYKKQVMYTSSKGEFEEFHDNADIVEIGSVYFNTKTNKVVGFISEEKEKAEVAVATSAMSVDPLCEKYYWITPYAYCLNNPVKFVDPDGRLVMSKQMQKENPELTKYVKNLSTDWNRKSTEFKKEFMEKSGMTEKQIKQMLTFGKGPTVEVVKDLKDSKGVASNGLTTGINSFQLDKDAVNMLENAKTSDDKASGKIMVESTTFHELTHIGNLKVNGNPQGHFTESGRAFEEGAYGQQIETFNVEKFWRSSQPVQPITPPSIPLLPVQQTVSPTTIPVQ